MDDVDRYLKNCRGNQANLVRESAANYAQFDKDLEAQRQELLENHAWVGKALHFLSQGLKPFIEQELRHKYSANWMNRVEEICLSREDRQRNIQVNLEDSYVLLKLIIKLWHDVFRQSLLERDKNLVYDLRDVRNAWAHPKPSEWPILERFTPRYTYTALTTIALLLSRIQADEQARAVDQLKQELEQRQQQKPDVAVDLYGRALELFNGQLELSSNALIGSGTTASAESRLIFNRDDVYIPLGLVEPSKKEEKQKIETIREISEEDFFTRVLREGQSKSAGKRIAIIGEPGSGKTTRLQGIAEWIFETLDDRGDVAIWIPLGAIGQKSLRDYLLQDWLRDAAQSLGDPPDAWRIALEEWLHSGKLWLLLDGVDEMAIANPLAHLAAQLREGWARSVRVVLTCRVNVWEANKNPLYNFDVFRNLDFSPEQVNDFIERCLGEQGQDLQVTLNEPGKERIRDLLKNPLRLMLLCSLWQRGEFQLPDTKAGLYEHFVQRIYAWKEEIICEKYQWDHAIYRMKQTELNRALGELAKRAIDGESSRFRLPERFVQEVMDEFDPALFDLALDIGWLNVVGVAEENPLETVYAFYHPSFEEYFAALAIDDWHFFLKHIPQNPQAGTYRIFEPQWREVYLLWMGRVDPLIKTVQETSVKTLHEFLESSLKMLLAFRLP